MENNTGKEIIVTTEDEDIKIPKELDDRLNMRLRKLKRKSKTIKLLSYLGTAAAFLILSTAIITINPTLRSFAEKVPVINTIVNSFYKDDSIEEAKNKGFIKMTNFVKEQDGFRFEIDELYFDGLRFSINTKIHGSKLNEYLKAKNNPIVNCNYVISTEKNGQRGLMNELFKVREGDENYIYSRAEKVFTESELNYILNNNNQFEVKLWFRGNNTESQLTIPVTLNNFTGIKKEEKNINYSFNSDFPIKDISIERIISSPTLSQMCYAVNMKENIDFLGFINPYILDTEGKKYNGESGVFRTFFDENYVKEGKDEFIKLSGYHTISNFEAAGKLKLNITPSFYLDNISPNKFCFEGIHVKQRKKFNLNMKDKFPQTITFDNNIINILSADYNDQKLIIKLDKASSDIEHINVSYGDVLDLESKETYPTEGIDNTYFTISSNKTDKDGNKVALGKKDSYTVTIEAEYVIHKKMEIPLKKFVN
jgi:hypothetical protein